MVWLGVVPGSRVRAGGPAGLGQIRPVDVFVYCLYALVGGSRGPCLCPCMGGFAGSTQRLDSAQSLLCLEPQDL